MKSKLFLLSIFICGIICLNAQKVITLQADFSKSTDLQKGTYGANCEWIGRPFTPASKSVIDMYTDLGKPTFRYPAGTGSNYINLITGFASGWKGMSKNNEKRNIDINKSLARSGKTEMGLDYHDLIIFLKKTGGSCSYVVNVSSMTIEDNRKVLTDIKNSGVSIKKFELGNEVYFSNYESAFKDANEYLEKGKKYSKMIKNIFPNAKIGVVVFPKFFTDEIFLDGPKDNSNRLVKWYKDVSKSSFFDAVVIHMYAKSGMKVDVKQADFFPYLKTYKYAISHIDARAQYSFDRIRKDYPEKEIWITEYNIGGFSGDLRKYRMRYSYLAGLMNSEYIMKMFANPDITESNWHAMFQWVRRQYPEPGSLIDEKFDKKVNYSFFKMFKEPVNESDKFLSLKINNVNNYDAIGGFKGKFSEVNSSFFYNKKSGNGYLMIVNKLDTEYKISINDIEKELGGKVNSYTALKPSSKLSLNDALESEEEKTLHKYKAKGDFITIKPYSFYKIEVVK